MIENKPNTGGEFVLMRDENPLLDLTGRHSSMGKPIEFTTSKQLEWLKEQRFDKAEIKRTIVLSAAKTVEKDKAHLEVISCRHVFPTNPTFEFLNDRSDFYGGKVDIWLKNVKGGEKLQFLIRTAGFVPGGATITLRSSNPTQTSLIPYTLSGSYNFVLGNVMLVPQHPVHSLALFSLEVQYHNAQYGSWLFWDCAISEVE